MWPGRFRRWWALLLPPVSVGLSGWWLFALVMVWTLPFWALALLLREDYRAVGIPMLPVVKGPVVTARAIRRYGWATALLSLLGVFALPEGGVLYGLLVILSMVACFRW